MGLPELWVWAFVQVVLQIASWLEIYLTVEVGCQIWHALGLPELQSGPFLEVVLVMVGLLERLH